MSKEIVERLGDGLKPGRARFIGHAPHLSLNQEPLEAVFPFYFWALGSDQSLKILVLLSLRSIRASSTV